MSERWVKGTMWNGMKAYVNMEGCILMFRNQVDGSWFTEIHSGSHAAFATEDGKAVQNVYTTHFVELPEHFLPDEHQAKLAESA